MYLIATTAELETHRPFLTVAKLPRQSSEAISYTRAQSSKVYRPAKPTQDHYGEEYVGSTVASENAPDQAIRLQQQGPDRSTGAFGSVGQEVPHPNGTTLPQR